MKDIEEKYSLLEIYMFAYIEWLFLREKNKKIWKYYWDELGIWFIDNHPPYEFPSYEEWLKDKE